MAIEHSLQAVLEKQLRPTEKLLWIGQPDPSRAAKNGRRFLGLGLSLIAGGTFWCWEVLRFFHGENMRKFSTPPLFFRIVELLFEGVFFLVGVLSVAFGALMMAVPSWLYRRAQKTLYAVTTERAIILPTTWPRWTHSYGPSDCSRARRTDPLEGRSDVYFADLYDVRSSGGFRLRGPFHFFRRVEVGGQRLFDSQIGFIGVIDPEAAEQALRSLQGQEVASNQKNGATPDQIV